MSFDNIFASLFQVVIIASGESTEPCSADLGLSHLLPPSQHLDWRHVRDDGRRLLRIVLVLHHRAYPAELRAPRSCASITRRKLLTDMYLPHAVAHQHVRRRHHQHVRRHHGRDEALGFRFHCVSRGSRPPCCLAADASAISYRPRTTSDVYDDDLKKRPRGLSRSPSLVRRAYEATHLFWVALALVSIALQASKEYNMLTSRIDLLDRIELYITIAFDVEILIRAVASLPYASISSTTKVYLSSR